MKSINTSNYPEDFSLSFNWQHNIRRWIRISKQLFLLLFLSFNVKAQLPVIDGNPNEWPGILNNATHTKKAFKHDPFNQNHVDDSWTGGSQDDDASPSLDWTWVYGNSNDKGDIGNAGAVLIGTKLYFFGDRASFSGDAQIGFWFFLNNVRPTGNGANPGSPFLGEHANGDLLIISNFTNGGGNAVPTIYRWTGKTPTAPGGPVVVTNATAALTTNNLLQNAPGGAAGTLMFNNERWIFTPKSGTAGTYPSPLFFEGYVDLGTIPGSSPCFQRFLLETRNSQSITASLQDLVAGNFSGTPLPPTVVGDEACVNDQPVTLTASCSHTSGTPTWYATATSTSALGTADGVSADGSSLTKSGLPVGTTTFYVSCKDGQCESERVPVTARINPLPVVDGLIKTEFGVTQLGVGNPPVLVDDVYQIQLSKTNVAHLFVSNPAAGSTYTWTRINCNGSAFIDDFATTFSSNGPTGTFTVVTTQNLGNAYCFKVSVVDNKGCVAEDIVEIRPSATAILCEVNGPSVVCAGSSSNTYTYLDGTTTLHPDFNYTWSISGGGGTINGAPQVNVNSVTVTATGTAGSYTVTLTITGKYNSLQDSPQPCNKTAVVKLVTLSLEKKDLTCGGGNNGEITATFTGGTPPYNIRINGGSYSVQSSPYTFTGLAGTEHTVDVYDANNCVDQEKATPGTPVCCVCVTCDGEVVVNENVTVNFNNTPPTYAGDADLLPYFSVDKSGGPTADKWKAVFNLGTKKLVLKSPATITVNQVNGFAPGVVINSTCDVVTEKGSAINVVSSNRNAGDLSLTANGKITLEGQVTNQVIGTVGLPGAITVTSLCAGINVGGLVQILGTDGGGNTVTLATCAPPPDCVPAPFSGDITINGLVKSFAPAHAGDLTLNRPNIRVISMNGSVVINANTAEPLYDEFSLGGGLYDIYGGLLSWVSANVNPGTIKVQALNDVIVNGHGTDPTGSVRKTFGAIAAIATASSAPGGLLDIRSLAGKIIGNDRAFDVSGRNRLTTNFAHIMLNAKGNIELNRPGANNNFNPVVNASGLGSGDKGGINSLRSFAGSISVGNLALVTAAVTSGTQGVNNFTSCLGINNSGNVTPAPVVSSDCGIPAPDALYTSCPNLESTGNRARGIPVSVAPLPVDINDASLQSFPNPFNRSTTISYTLAETGFVLLKVYNVLGKEIATLVSENQKKGSYQYQWNALNLPSGTYYAKIQMGKFSASNKLMIKK